MRRLFDKLIINVHRIRCGMYRDTCSLCSEWKAKKKARQGKI